MKRLDQTKRELKNLASSDARRMFARLKELVSPTAPIFNDILLQESRSHKNEQQFLRGMITPEDQHVAYNRITKAVLEMVDELREEDLAVEAHSVFDLKTPHLKPDLIRCNRREAKSRFEESFQRLQNVETQHYILHAERHQQPRSFVERVVFELEGRRYKLNYEPAGDYHIRAVQLEPGTNLEGAKLFFQQYMSSRFGQDVEHLAEVGAAFPPCRQYDFVVTVLEFNSDWKAHTGSLLQWIIKEFCEPPPPLPTRFLFFYIIEEQLLHPPAVANILGFLNGQPNSRKLVLEAIETLQALRNCTLIPQLKAVPVEELSNWFHEFVSNEEEVDRLVREVLEPLPKKQNGKQLDMSFIEKRLMDYIS